MHFSILLTTFGIAIAALIAPIASANALPPVRAGVLECHGGQNVGYRGRLRDQSAMRVRERGPPAGTLRRHRAPLGLDLGITAQTQIAWAVNAPNSRLGRGELAGSYGGVGANASIGVGGGGNFLVGGPANAYALQPLSVQGQTGLNVAAGIADLELEPVVAWRSALPRPPASPG